MIRRIGKGTFGTVHKVRDNRNGKCYALKICKADPDELPGLLSEALIMSQINHPNVTRCEEILLEKNKLLLKMKLMKCDLNTLIEKQEYDARNLFIQIASGLKYLHSKDVVHCDLKPANILYRKSHKRETVKISDFNSAQVGKICDTAGCTSWYMAPESIISAMYDKCSDIWSLACILFEMLTGHVLFPCDSDDDHFDMIVDLRLEKDYLYLFRAPNTDDKKSRIEEIEDKNARDLLAGMLCIDSVKRFTIDEVLNHPYCNFSSPQV